MKLVAKNFNDPSRYLWSDLPTASEDGPHRALTEAEQQVFGYWAEQGYVIATDAVSHGAVDRFLSDVHTTLNDPAHNVLMTYWDEDGHHLERASENNYGKLEAKVLDLHVRLASAEELIFSDQIMGFLRFIFQEEPVAFQSLYFHNGSQQGAHQDTAFVYTDPPMKFAASWIALEDVQPQTGELFFYPGSNRLDDVIFSSGTKALLSGDPEGPQYSTKLEEILDNAGLKKKSFLGRKGDALIWSADLVHGGEKCDLRRSRRSLVTHYCPKSAAIPYMSSGTFVPTQCGSQGWVVGQY